MDRVQKTWDASSEISVAQQSYLKVAKQVYNKNIVHVVASGNLGHLNSQLANMGVQTSKNAFKSVLANEFTTVVGATDNRGTTTAIDDRAADFTSDHAGAEFAVNGVRVSTPKRKGQTEDCSSGTSFSAPQVTGLVHRMVSMNPNLSVAQIENILCRSAESVNGKESQIGAGQIMPERAILLTQQSLESK